MILLPDWRRLALPAVAVVVVVSQVLATVSVLPYRLDYFNPMLGGAAAAEEVMQMGWGQGGKEVTEFIVDDANGRQVTVQKSSVTPVFSYFAPSNLHFVDFGLGSPETWYETSYFVPGLQEWQRDLSSSYRVMQQYHPVHVVMIEGVRFFEVYTQGLSRYRDR